MTELEEQIKLVAEARQEAEEASKRTNEAYQKWLAAHDQLLANEKYAKTSCQEAEGELRELTLKAYAETGDKAPAVGVGIREVTKLDYDVTKAFDWALEHRIALQLNKSAFDKLAKTAPETRPSFVKITTEPQATIATELQVKEE